MRTFPPLWREYWSTVGNETWLVAGELIELSDSVTAHFASFIKPVDGGLDYRLDWKAAAAAADEWPCSTTERYLLDLVLSLIQPDEYEETEVRKDDEGYYDVRVTKGTRKFDARSLGSMGSWRGDVARILNGYILGQ